MDKLADQTVNLITDDHYWTMDIEPQRRLLDLRLRELWRYKAIVVILDDREF